MQRKLLLTLGLASLSLCFSPVGTALAQAPSGGGSSQQPTQPSSPQGTSPGQSDPSMQPGGQGSAGGGGTPSKMDDKKFVKEAAVGGMMEVELGKLAAQKASREDIKQFGQKMVDDHSKANDELKEVAGKENMEIPSSIDPKHQKMIDKMSKMEGDDFDKAYVKNMVKDHEKDVKDFQMEADSGSNANVKAFASKTLPTLQGHLTSIKMLNKGGKAKEAMSSK